MLLCCTITSGLQVGHCKMDGIRFEFKDIISLYMKDDFERWWFFSVDILHYIYIVITYY